MIQSAKKRTFFLIGVLITTTVGAVVDYTNTNYLKKTSSLVSTAYADIAPSCSSCGCGWTELQCYNYGSGNGDGCCGDASSDSGGSCDADGDSGAGAP